MKFAESIRNRVDYYAKKEGLEVSALQVSESGGIACFRFGSKKAEYFVAIMPNAVNRSVILLLTDKVYSKYFDHIICRLPSWEISANHSNVFFYAEVSGFGSAKALSGACRCATLFAAGKLQQSDIKEIPVWVHMSASNPLSNGSSDDLAFEFCRAALQLFTLNSLCLSNRFTEVQTHTGLDLSSGGIQALTTEIKKYKLQLKYQRSSDRFLHFSIDGNSFYKDMCVYIESNMNGGDYVYLGNFKVVHDRTQSRVEYQGWYNCPPSIFKLDQSVRTHDLAELIGGFSGGTLVQEKLSQSITGVCAGMVYNKGYRIEDTEMASWINGYMLSTMYAKIKGLYETLYVGISPNSAVYDIDWT